MPWRVYQDYAHHIETPPVQVVAPWHLYSAETPIPDGIDKGWLPAHIVPLLEQQVWQEFQGDPPPVDPKPIPAPFEPDIEEPVS